jgi:hypothetical protein
VATILLADQQCCRTEQPATLLTNVASLPRGAVCNVAAGHSSVSVVAVRGFQLLGASGCGLCISGSLQRADVHGLECFTTVAALLC